MDLVTNVVSECYVNRNAISRTILGFKNGLSSDKRMRSGALWVLVISPFLASP